MPITREEFESGIEFIHMSYAEGRRLKFSPKSGVLTYDFIVKLNPLEYLCVIDSINDSFLVFKIHIFSEFFTGKMYFKDCIKC